MSFNNCFLSVLFTYLMLHSVDPSCVFQDGKYDLSSLDWPEGWPVSVGNNNSTKFILSLCKPLNYSTSSGQNCLNSSICMISGNNATSYAQDGEFTIADNVGDAFSFFYVTKRMCKNDGKFRASINFICGPTLGSPEMLLYNECQVNFNWQTSAACSVKPKRREVPCYVIDNDGYKRDLSYLLKQEGGYRVTTYDEKIGDFFINVCSTIVPSHDGTQNCNSNSSACSGFLSNQPVSMGMPSERLQFTSEGLALTYFSHPGQIIPPTGCEYIPKTRILFKCPTRGQSQPPALISNYDTYRHCHHEIIWYTEHACPENSLRGSVKKCQFTQDLHGIEIDLSPLKAQTEYHVSANVAGNEFNFTFSVCQGLGGFVCGGKAWKSNSVCMMNASSSEVVGTTIQSELKYVDGQVMMVYPSGTSCSNGIPHTSVINFICNASISSVGSPQHVSSNNCLHIFKWETKLACLKHPIDTWCSATINNTVINLERLHISDGNPWEAIDRRDGTNNIKNSSYFLNICGPVSQLGNLSYCGKDSAACVQQNGQFTSLGQFSASPLYDPISKHVKLEYFGGSQCTEKYLWRSIVNFICRPDLLNDEPVLKYINETDCLYEFEWLTSFACPDRVIDGSDCRIFDSSLGITFDLSSLKDKTYETTGKLHKFYLGICSPISKSPCSLNQTNSVSACMVENVKGEANPIVIGEANTTLSYFDGVISLEYLSPNVKESKANFKTLITFICDENSGSGNPVLVSEEDFIYSFHWYTSLVCLNSTSVECVVHDPLSHFVYDLSELSSEKHWVTQDRKKQKIFLNVCRSLNLPSLCDPTAAACIVKGEGDSEKAVISNIGRITSPPELNSAGHLTLTYSHGDPCTAFGVKTNYSSVIHFLCAERGSSSSGPIFLNQVGECQYTFLWTTVAACPTSNLVSKNSCQLTDPESGFTFDLSPLKIQGNRKPYATTTASRTFELNICGSVADGCHSPNAKMQSLNISACETKNDTMLTVLGVTNDYFLSYSQGQDLTLTYESSDSLKKVHITFPCENSSKETELKFIEENPLGEYNFEMATPLSCKVTHYDCSFFNVANGDEYDLSPLSRYSNGNWEVPDKRESKSNMRYHINFCRPLNKDSSYSCPGGTSSACQTDTTQPLSNGFNLGSMLSAPNVSKDGIVTVKYTEGSYCHNGQFKRSTTINLFCAHMEGELKFIGETPECEYIFSLQTPAACPVQTSTGSDCKVKDPVYGYAFDLSQLQKKNSNYNITHGGYIYSFNICGKLNGFVKDCQNSGICQTKPNMPGFSKSLGLPSSNLTYRKGLITLLYDQGSANCHGQYNRSSIITFTCDHAYEDRDGPIFMSEAEDCTYLFQWPTVHACPPFDVIECSVRDNKGNFFDLSNLSLSSDNYYLKYPNTNQTFAINLCRSVVPTPDSLCSYTAAACLVDSASPLNSVNLGRVGQGPYFDNGHIKINYTSGDPCNIELADSARFMQTIIEFSCDKTKIHSQPEFIGQDGCNYYFDWHTAFACVSEIPATTGDCIAVDPIKGFTYDLSPLKNHTFVTEHGTHKFHVSVCESPSDSPCHNHSGMCQEETLGSKRHWSGGVKNSNLLFDNGVLLLNYSGGDSCHKGQFQRNTIIQFQCGKALGEPEFIYESQDCTYFFLWETELACEPFVHCAIRNGSQMYDLTVLAESFFIAGSNLPNDNSSYYISVCGSLPPVNGISCPHGAAICQLSDHLEGSIKMTTAQSLGKVEHPPFIDFMGHPTSIYTNGSECSTMTGSQNRARIIFLCHPETGVMGEPVLIDKTEDCLYLFEWKTNVVCNEKPSTQSTSVCEYEDKGKGLHFDLSPIQRIGSYYTVSNAPGQSEKVYLLNICGTVNSSNLENCKDSGICLQENNVAHNFGLASTMKFSYDGYRLTMTLVDGDDCPSGVNGKRHSSVLFICDPSAGIGKPELYKKYTCLVVFLWRTNLVCASTNHQCSFHLDGNFYDLSLLSSLSHNWNTSDDRNNIYYINLCRGVVHVSEESRGCAPSAAVCFRDENGSHMSLGMVQTMLIKSNNSDLLLTFTGGDRGACTTVNSTTTLWATARFVMRCGHSLGNPKILSGPDTQCFYDFLWETSLACSEKLEQVMIEENGTLYDKRFQYSMDLNDILNHSFSVGENSREENYTYEINLSKVFQNSTDPSDPCADAAVCQTKPGSSFRRNIGSFDTRKFYIRGSELHLILTSRKGPCGKSRTKNVTTIFNMACSSAAGVGTPKFLYESGKCDYVFEWETIAVCTEFHRKPPTVVPPTGEPNFGPLAVVSPSHTTETVICVVLLVVVFSGFLFILVNPNRRSSIALRFRSLFGRVHLPHFQYRRCDNERLILMDAAQSVHYDNENDRDVELLT